MTDLEIKTLFYVMVGACTVWVIQGIYFFIRIQLWNKERVAVGARF